MLYGDSLRKPANKYADFDLYFGLLNCGLILVLLFVMNCLDVALALNNNPDGIGQPMRSESSSCPSKSQRFRHVYSQ